MPTVSGLGSVILVRNDITSTNPLRIKVSGYGSAIVLGYVSNVGGLNILIRRTGSSTVVRDLINGTTFSDSRVSVTISGDYVVVSITTVSAFLVSIGTGA